MNTYTEDEIRAAWGDPTNLRYLPNLLGDLEKGRKGMKDTDTVTVKEIRDTWRRIDQLEQVGSVTSGEFLADILLHREPDYPIGTIWQDARCVYWYRLTEKKWNRFGSSTVFADNIPERPLRKIS